MAYDKIARLKERDHVRKRPAMWIGTSSNPAHLVTEIIDNSLDEAQAGHCTEIHVTISESGFVEVLDNGRGFPTGLGEDGQSHIMAACNQLFSGGKFDDSAYATSGGLHGVGLSVTNFLSDKFTIRSWRPAELRTIEFRDGLLESEVRSDPSGEKYPSGTYVSFLASKAIFDEVTIEVESLRKNLRFRNNLCKHCSIWVNGVKIEPYSDEELIGAKTDTPLIHVVAQHGNQKMEITFSHDTRRVDTTGSGAVNLLLVNEGSHIKSATRAIQQAWIKSLGTTIVQPQDIECGLRVFTSVMLTEPKYSSQNKERLANRLDDLKDLQAAAVEEILKKILHKDYIKYHVALKQKFEEWRRSQERASSSKFLDSVLEMGESDGESVSRGHRADSRLVDCTSTKRSETELILCEGNSAAGSLLKVRDSRYHAILPLRGKVLSIVDADVKTIMTNNEFRSLINSMGSGLLHKEDVSRLRYGKVIIGTDADPDGSHIYSLLIGAFSYLTRKLIEAGLLYIAISPLYIQYPQGKMHLAYTEEELLPRFRIKRIKGLGELNPDEAKEVFFGKSRRLVRVTAENAHLAMNLVSEPEAKRQLMLSINMTVE